MHFYILAKYLDMNFVKCVSYSCLMLYYMVHLSQYYRYLFSGILEENVSLIIVDIQCVQEKKETHKSS